MRKLFIFLLMAGNSFAGIGSSHGGSVINTNELKNYITDLRTDVRSDQISFSNESSTTFVPVINVCIDGEDYRTIKKYEIYSPEARSQKSVIAVDYLRRKIELDSDNKPISKAFNVIIYKNNRKTEGDQSIIKSGKYYLPDCE